MPVWAESMSSMSDGAGAGVGVDELHIRPQPRSAGCLQRSQSRTRARSDPGREVPRTAGLSPWATHWDRPGHACSPICCANWNAPKGHLACKPFARRPAPPIRPSSNGSETAMSNDIVQDLPAAHGDHSPERIRRRDPRYFAPCRGDTESSRIRTRARAEEDRSAWPGHPRTVCHVAA